MTLASASSFDPSVSADWESRRATTLGAARRRSHFIRALRLALLGLAAAIAILVVAQIVLSGMNPSVVEEIVVTEETRMINPRFTGRDESGAPYVLTADAALRGRGDDRRLTQLERPQLDFALLSAGEDAEGVLAQTGIYDADQRILDLTTDVLFSTRSGYQFEAQHARVFLSEDRVTGDSPVTGQGPMGNIRSDEYEILDGGERVIFRGNVSTRILNDRSENGDTP